ncbi:MAG: carbohydrate ABC transporter permease [Chloroflexota bacterium]
MATAMQPNAKASPYSVGYRVGKGLNITMRYLALMGIGIFFLFPIVFMIVLSLQPNDTQLIQDSRTIYAFIPRTISFENYQDVFDWGPFDLFFFNSLLITVVTIAIGLVINSMLAYSLARLRWRGRNLILAIIVALMIIPFQTVSVPLLLIVNRFGWLDSYHVQIIPFLANPFFIFLLYQFFIGLPLELEEAALVDGANRLRVYFQLIIPLSMPIFATVAILQFLAMWGNFFWPLMVTRGPEFRPLSVGMQVFFSNPNVPWGDILAFGVMYTLPTLIVYLFFQRWFVQSVATTGVKG